MHSNANISLALIEGPCFASPYSRAWSDFLLVADYLCPVKKYLSSQWLSRGCSVSPCRFVRDAGCGKMISAVYDALSTTEIHNLLRRAIEVINAGLPADHVLIQDLGAVDTNSSFNSSIGWDRATAAGIAHALAELSQQPACAEMAGIGDY